MKPLPGHQRKTLALSDEMWAAIAEFRHGHRIATEVEAVRRLINAGLRAEARRALARKENISGKR